MNWGLIEYEAEKLVPRRQKVADIICCCICLPAVIVGMPWALALLVESGILK
ncbi:hypothetical protein NJI34_34640 [Pseudomonas sp. S 311-6]|nr:hypothetical protein [Pseudomonas sp. S 311-6]